MGESRDRSSHTGLSDKTYSKAEATIRNRFANFWVSQREYFATAKDYSIKVTNSGANM